MLSRRNRRKVPALNTTSTADISFMLLILFLVTSSMDTDKGLVRQLPPPPDENEEVVRDVKQRNVMTIRLSADDRLTCNGDVTDYEQLGQQVMAFVDNAGNDPSLPELTEAEVRLIGRTRVSNKHIIAIEADRQTSYDAYFRLQNTIVAAYTTLRTRLARRHFGHDFAACSPEERDALMTVYPQRISDTTPTTEEGGAQ